MRFATQNDYWLVASKKEEFDKYGEKGKPVERRGRKAKVSNWISQTTDRLHQTLLM